MQAIFQSLYMLLYFGFASTVETMHKTDSPVFILFFHMHTCYQLHPQLTDEYWKTEETIYYGLPYLFLYFYVIKFNEVIGLFRK